MAAKGFLKQKWVLRNADNSSPEVRRVLRNTDKCPPEVGRVLCNADKCPPEGVFLLRNAAKWRCKPKYGVFCKERRCFVTTDPIVMTIGLPNGIIHPHHYPNTWLGQVAQV